MTHLLKAHTDSATYTQLWAKQAPVAVPLGEETSSALRALQLHALFLFDNPLAENLMMSERDRFVREQLACYRELLDIYGLIDTTALLKRIAVQFLRSFYPSEFGLLYIPDEDITYTPMYRSAMTLAGRVLHVAGKDGDTIQYILSWLLYLSKIPLERPDLYDSSETDWILRQVEPNPMLCGREILHVLKRITSWLMSVEPGEVGNHGPGTTFGGLKSVPEKNQDYRPTIQTNELLRFHVDDVEYDVFEQRPNELMLVYKDIGALRPITREPVESQLAQQALKFDLYRTNDDDPECNAGLFIRYRDQSLSQDCALRGSRISSSGIKPSTIDLSAASDHLSVDLVVELFSGNLLHLLMAGRTWDCLVGEDRALVELSMYGGMGSALTFPVQSTVFAACAIYATIAELYKAQNGVEWLYEDIEGNIVIDEAFLSDYLSDLGLKPQYRAIQREIRVYGDDICVPDFAADRLIKLLQSLGLVVNVGKSFTGNSPVREACGVYALAGRDITPKRYRIPVQQGRMIDAAEFEALRAAANEMYFMGYRHLHRALIRYVRDTAKFISSKEETRKSLKGSAVRPKRVLTDGTILARVDRYHSQKLGVPKLLFEEDRGRDDYVGFVSNRSSIPDIIIDVHERVPAYTTYFVETETARDESSEYYHLTVNYRRMNIPEFDSSEAHGSLPRGIRLIKRNAYRVVPTTRYWQRVWGWAPR